ASAICEIETGTPLPLRDTWSRQRRPYSSLASSCIGGRLRYCTRESTLGILMVARDRLGRRLHDLRISVTDRCNFRCPYCMPAEIYGESYRFLPRPELLTFEEIERLARLFVAHGVEKIRIT